MARQEHHLKKSKNSAILPRKHARAQERGTSKVCAHINLYVCLYVCTCMRVDHGEHGQVDVCVSWKGLGHVVVASQARQAGAGAGDEQGR